jgi:hypothetical protein
MPYVQTNRPRKHKKAKVPRWRKLMLANRRVTRRSCMTWDENKLPEIASSLQHAGSHVIGGFERVSRSQSPFFHAL